MQPENKVDDKNALREKNRISAKQFIKMKRGKIKQEKSNSESFETIRNHIRQGRAKQLEQSLFSNKNQIILTFLFSENEMKQTPIMEIITNQDCVSLLKAINKWSFKNTDLIIRQIYMEDNQLRNNDFRGRFQNLNKLILQVLSKKINEGKTIIEQIMILGEKDSLYYHLSKNFLNLEVIISSLSILKTKNNMLMLYYHELLTKSDLKEMQGVAKEAKGYQSIVLRQKIWTKVDASLFKIINKDNVGLLTLKELKYNVWHQLANHSSSQFFKTIEILIEKMVNNQAIAEDLHNMLVEIDSSGEIVMDKCLRLWNYKDIKQLLLLSSKVQNLILSTKCIINLFYNRHLSQTERQSLIKECLSGQISSNGFIKIIPILLQKPCKNSKIMLYKKPLRYTYNIIYDKLQVKKQKDSSGEYPLTIYLNTYKASAKLQIIQQLLIETLTPKYIKKQMTLLIKTAVKNRVKVQNNSSKKQQIENIFDYYQPLWKVVTFLPHGDVLQYLLTKIFINCYQIKLINHHSYFYLEPVGTHFIAFYIQNSPFLGEDSINKNILSSIIKCKANQKNISSINLDFQLIRSLNKIQVFHTSKDYLLAELRNYLRGVALNLSAADLMNIKQIQVNSAICFSQLMIDTLCYPLMKKKPSLLSQEQLVSKLTPQIIKELLESMVLTNDGIKSYIRNICQKYNIQGQSIDKPSFSSLSTSNLYNLQSYYFTEFKQEHKNQDFFDGLQNYFSSITKIQLCRNQKELKYYCFRLRPSEKHLTFKFKKLLSLGMDVYFSKYEKGFNFNEDSSVWNNLLRRMTEQKCSFLSALITQPTATFPELQDIFQNQAKTETSWIQWSLLYKIRNMYKYYYKNDVESENQRITQAQIKGPFQFCNNKANYSNYDFIDALVKYSKSLGLQKQTCASILQTYFQINITQLAIEIQNLQHLDRVRKQDKNKLIIQEKKKDVVGFIDKWMPSLIKQTQQAIDSSLGNGFADRCQLYTFTLLKKCFYKQQDYILKALLNHQTFSVIPKKRKHTKFHLLKFKYSSSSALSHFIVNRNDQDELIEWIDLMTKYGFKLLLELIKSLDFQQQRNILIHIIKCINTSTQILGTQNKKKYSSFIELINRCVSGDRTLDLLQLIDNQPINNKQDYKKIILRSIQNTDKVTIRLIVLDPSIKTYFYMKDQKIRLYSNFSFYHKCNRDIFNVYIRNLQKHHKSSPNISIHLSNVINCLVQSQQWQRLKLLLAIKLLLKETVILSLKAIALTSNKKIKQNIPIVKEIISIIFSHLQQTLGQFDYELFYAAFTLDYEQAFKIFKPKILTIFNFRECIKTCPQSSSLFLSYKVAVDKEKMPVGKNVGFYFPMVAVYPKRLNLDKWLIDNLKLQHYLFKQLSIQKEYFRFMQSFCIYEQALAQKSHIFDGILNDRQICVKFLKCNQVESISKYKKYIPDIDNIIKQQLTKDQNIANKKHKCMNLTTLHPNLLKQLILGKYFYSRNTKESCSIFLRIVETANLDLIKLYTTTNHITIDYKFLKGMEDEGFIFWGHLLSISNESFIISFIKEYKLFSLFSTEQYSQKLLKAICSLKLNKLLQFTIQYFEATTGKKAIFAAETHQNKPSISANGVFYLPIEQSLQNNFYQTYFLIRSSNNDCVNFKASGRFITYRNPDEWNYIPQMKRRADINNTLMVSLREAQEMTFRLNVLLPNIFEFRHQGEPIYVDPYVEPLPLKIYNQCLKKFILDITKRTLHLTKASGTFQKLCFVLFNKQQTKIPEEELDKHYPSQMKIIKKLKKFIQGQKLTISLKQLFQCVPQFKPLLLVYNPSLFLTNPAYMNELMGKEKSKSDMCQYLRGIQINFVQFETKYSSVLQGYIVNYFFTSSVPLGNPTASFYLTREALVLIFLQICYHERRWKDCSIFNLCKANMQMINTHELQEQTLYDLSTFLNIRAQGKIAFDLMVWNKIIQEIEQIENCWKRLGKPATKQYNFSSQVKNIMISNYSKIATKQMERYQISNISTILSEVYDDHVSNCNKKGTLIEIGLVLNVLLFQNDIKMLDQKVRAVKGGNQIQKYNIKLVKNILKEISFNSPTELTLEVKYSIEKHQSKQLSLLFIDYITTVQTLQHSLYLSNLSQLPQAIDLNQFCQAPQRQLFLKNYKFRYTVQSFKGVKYESLINMLEYGPFKQDGLVGKMIYQMEKMQEKLLGTKNIKVYSTSDIYGPINFSQEKEDDKIIDCLGFYEFIELPKLQQIKITYTDKKASANEQNTLMLKQLKSYLTYYLAYSKDQDHSNKLKLQNQVFISLHQVKNQEKAEIQWWKFGAWAVCEIYCLALHYCSDLSSKIEKILDVRVSFASLIKYYQKYLQFGGQQSMKIALEKLLFQKDFNRLIECIVLMITEDVRNIMKIVKGIIIKLDVNKKTSKKKGRIIICELASAVSVEYLVKDGLLIININLEMNKHLNKSDQKGDDCNLLVERKEFLDSVFTSAQFLTDYFLVRNQLNNTCLTISTSTTYKLNSTVNFHIQYSNLYKFIDKMRQEKTIKQIESFLIRLKQYLHNNMDKAVNIYLNSQEIANKHQVFLINKCEAIKKKVPYEKIQAQKELVYDSLQSDPQNGLFQVTSLMNQIGNDQNIKSAFLIQIYKSYYTTIVGEGMTFVVGYKSNKKKAQVIKITKAQNINLINIVELDYIMLVSKNIPTNDELNKNKIIRIFITDSNKNLYRLHDQIKDYFLSLPEESEARNIAQFAPLVASNIKLIFSLNEQRQKDTKQAKIFFIDLNQSGKFKLSPLPDKPLSPLNSCKKNMEFKEAIRELQRSLKSFFNHSIKIIIDLPQQFSVKYINVDFSHIISLVSADIQQFLIKYEFQPMRNQSLDSKLSIEKQFILNKNSIIQLRKLALSNHFNKIRIRIRDNKPGITFSQNQIVIAIDTTNMATLPSSSQYLSVIADRILSNQKKRMPKYVSFVQTQKNESTQILMKELDLINCIPFQLQQIETASSLIELFFTTKLPGFKIIIDKKKSQIKFSEGIQIHLSLTSIEREFYSTEEIIKAFLAFRNKNLQANVKSQTYYNPITNTITIQDCNASKFKLIYQDDNKKWKINEASTHLQHSKAIINFTQKHINGSRYYLLESQNIYCNYFYTVDPAIAIKQKNAQATRCKSKHLYLFNKKSINLNFTNMSYVQTDPVFKETTANFHILKSSNQKNSIIVRLFSKNIYFLDIIYEDSMILTVNYASNINIFNNEIQSSRIVISSDGQLCLDRTKFIQMEAYKKKPVLIKQKQNENNNSEFRQINEFASEKQFDMKLGDINNIQNLVYVVNDQCKKYLTRAGEPRVDYIQLCDTDGNPIDYKPKLQVMFVHINRLAIIRPEIFNRNMQFGLRWVPTIRGHYYLYINNVRMNPPYQIGVCAAQADYQKSIVTLPKITKICYCEQTELMLDLRDHFNNLYTQTEEDIIGDELVIELKCSKMGENLKIQKSQINKYGLKKIKFNFNNPEADSSLTTEIVVEICLNLEHVTFFTIIMEGLSLKQRKKFLEKDIGLSSKNYYKDISVNRNKFLQDLFVIAEKSLHTNFSVKFVNEPGVDAGGVKREFYDMVGNEIKSEKNPFFKLINPNTMEYFLNPQILRNKKKLEYMQLWGKYLANSFLNSYLIGVSFSPVFVKLLYDISIDYQDLLSIMPAQQRKQYEFLLKASPQQLEDLDLYFTVMIDKKKCVEAQLKQGGKSIQVNSKNVKEYLQCTAQVLVTERYKEIIIAFRKGFETVLELGLFKKWIRSTQFWCLTAGSKEITPQLVLNYTIYQGSNIENISGWFRRFISEASHEVLVGFLKFSSGSSSIDFGLASKITVTFENAGDNPKKLPISHTCWKEIVVPKYKNYDILKKLLTAAFIYCSEGFGFG